MPLLQLMAERANEAFGRERIEKLTVETFDRSFARIAADLGIARSEAEQRYLESWPASLQEAFKAVVRSAVTRSPRVPITVCWAPGYDFELMVAESRQVGQSIGAITIFLRSRYPGD
jgi:hypothetical protein